MEGIITTISAALKLIGDIFRFTLLVPPKGSGHLGEAVFNWMSLSEDARKKRRRSKFIKAGGTRDTLMDLIDFKKDNYSILAICGNKGDFAGDYYKKNFQNCKAVRRVFSYDAICNEFKTKNKDYALKGLKMHLNEKATGGGDVEVFLIPKGKRIKDLAGHNFDPPLSFGLAILVDGNNSPKKAIVHWEMDAEPLKHLIAIEGFIIDDGQQELLNELVKLHKSIAGSMAVLSDAQAIIEACAELEEIWETQSRDSERGKR